MSYANPDDIELRLLGKVRFTDDDEDANKFPRRLLRRLQREAEGQVERDLSPRYAAPFQGLVGDDFKTLPSTTLETLRTMCELMTVIRVLGNDFGRGTVNDGGAYKNEQTDLYKALVARELKHREGAEGAVGTWAYPPLTGLMTHAVNAQDDGGHGVILVTSTREGDYPRDQITDPSENFSNGRVGR